MNELFDKLIWFFGNADAHELAGPLVMPIVVGLALYQSHYPYVLLRALYHRAFGDGFAPFTASDAPSIGLTIPSLLRSKDDLEGLHISITSLLASGYAGQLSIVVVIDGSGVSPALFDELRAWSATLERPSNVRLDVLGTPERWGKAYAGEKGVRHLVELAERGELSEKPALFYNMDADCELGPHALDRLARTLLRRSRLTGRPASVVTSHVSIRERDYYTGLRDLFTLKGQIRVAVAREYLVAIGIGRHNVMRLLPQTGASGALYAMWFDIAEQAPAWARFISTLRWRDYAKWWLGSEPPHFDPDAIEPLPEGMTGMGDDTWMSWLAMAARFERGRWTLTIPRTPLHALVDAFVKFVARPFRYDPDAKVYTTTPTTLSALFRQRVRWNVSRIWTVQCWGIGLLYHLAIGIPAITDVVISTLFQATIVGGLLLAPFAGRAPAMAPALFLLVELGYNLERFVSTLLAMFADRHERGQWKKLLGLPLAGTFHLVFNVATTLVGFAKLVLGGGLNDGFAPEHTLVRGLRGRPALGYRLRRFFALSIRAIRYADVPLGWFWLGWDETPWTPSGYEGWTSGKIPPLVKPRVTPAVAKAPAPSSEPVDDDALPDSGVRARPSLPPREGRSAA